MKDVLSQWYHQPSHRRGDRCSCIDPDANLLTTQRTFHSICSFIFITRHTRKFYSLQLFLKSVMSGHMCFFERQLFFLLLTHLLLLWLLMLRIFFLYRYIFIRWLNCLIIEESVIIVVYLASAFIGHSVFVSRHASNERLLSYK